MALKKVKLGDLLELCDERNSDLKYDLSDVRGISIKKVFIDTKADMEGVSLKPYVLVKPDSFAYVKGILNEEQYFREYRVKSARPEAQNGYVSFREATESEKENFLNGWNNSIDESLK